MSVKRARDLRKRMTPQELALWFRLRELKHNGWHFRRQSPEAPYILDFVCRSAMLVVEVDGAQHSGDAQSARDAQRDAELSRRGFTVLRFWASDVGRELDGVVQTILNALERSNPTRRALRARHPPPSGEGLGPRYNNLVRLGLRKKD